MSKEETIEVRIERDELIADQQKGNQVIVGGKVLAELRRRGVPVIGILAPFGVEHGRMEIYTDKSGLDGDELVFSWTGVPLPPNMRNQQFTFKNSLADAMAAEEDEF